MGVEAFCQAQAQQEDINFCELRGEDDQNPDDDQSAVETSSLSQAKIHTFLRHTTCHARIWHLLFIL